MPKYDWEDEFIRETLEHCALIKIPPKRKYAVELEINKGNKEKKATRRCKWWRG